MTHDVAERSGSTGRHRSPWGRSGRILPVRWGRVVAVVLALLMLVAGLVLIRFRLGGDGAGGPVGSPGSLPVSADGTSPDVLTAATAPPAPRRSGTAGSTAASPLVGLPQTLPSATVSRGATRLAAPPSASPGPVTPRQVGPVLGVSASTVNLGPVDSTWRLDLRGEGTAAVDVTVGTTPTWLAVVPQQRRIDPGANVPLMITLNRKTAPAGPLDVTVPVGAGNGVGGADVRITATVGDSPRIVSVASAPAQVVRTGCRPAGAPTTAPTTATRATVTVTADDSTGVFAVELAVTLPDGQTRRQPMSLGSAEGNRSTWTSELAAPEAAGTITYTADVADLNGRHTQAPGALTVLPCPA